MKIKELIEALEITKEDVENKLIDELQKKFEVDYEDCIDKAHREKKKLIKSSVAELIKDSLEADIKKELAEFRLCPTNLWGEPEGKEKSFTEFITSEVQKYLRLKVDYNGKIEFGKSSYNGDENVLMYLIRKEMYSIIEKEIQAVFRETKGVVSQSLQEAMKKSFEHFASKMTIKSSGI